MYVYLLNDTNYYLINEYQLCLLMRISGLNSRYFTVQDRKKCFLCFTNKPRYDTISSFIHTSKICLGRRIWRHKAVICKTIKSRVIPTVGDRLWDNIKFQEYFFDIAEPLQTHFLTFCILDCFNLDNLFAQ